jgi:hypothetical protein
MFSCLACLLLTLIHVLGLSTINISLVMVRIWSLGLVLG